MEQVLGIGIQFQGFFQVFNGIGIIIQVFIFESNAGKDLFRKINVG
jgi:hypothetical protein